MNRQEANFQDLLTSYYERTPAFAAAKHIDSEGHTWEYTAPQTEFDSPFETRSNAVKEIASGARDLFRCYSVLEIAALAGFIREIDKSAFGREVRVILESAFAATYLAEWLDLPLIRLLKARLNGVDITLPEESDDITDCVMAFLDLDRRYRLARGDAHFALVSARFSNYAPNPLRHLLKVCEDPKAFAEQLLCPLEEREKGGEELHGLSWLFEFCFELEELLNRLEGVPILQAAIWGHYQRWLGHKETTFRGHASLIHGLFESWSATLGEEAAQEITSYTSRSWRAVEAVTSDEYAPLLERVATNATTLAGQGRGVQQSIKLVSGKPLSFELAAEDWKLKTQNQDEIMGADA
ncbi:MAG TPA: hypothetical protein VGW57_12285 [Chthoniobacterales bacterium]|nr:hypothetical protein [Chthoniobacterales bacterium]